MGFWAACCKKEEKPTFPTVNTVATLFFTILTLVSFSEVNDAPTDTDLANAQELAFLGLGFTILFATLAIRGCVKYQKAQNEENLRLLTARIQPTV